MKIQFVSDLHLEFYENRVWLENHPLEVTGDILLIAGEYRRNGFDPAKHIEV